MRSKQPAGTDWICRFIFQTSSTGRGWSLRYRLRNRIDDIEHFLVDDGTQSS